MGLGLGETLILVAVICAFIFGPKAIKEFLKAWTWFRAQQKIVDAKVREALTKLEKGEISPDQAEVELDMIVYGKEKE